MRRAAAAALFCCVATWTAGAQGQTNAPSGGKAPPGNANGQTNAGNAGDVSPEEIERALQADQAAKQKAQGGAATAPTSPASPPGGPSGATIAANPGGGGGASGWGAVGRFFQSLNPDISAIVDFAGGAFSDDEGTIKSGDDPQSTGFKAQEIELALQAVVDPYFRADIFLTIPNLAGLEVEEAFLTTTHLPANLQIKAGIFRAGLGRQNAQHLHLQDFTRRPLLNAQLLGVDGLRAPGLEINWLVPRIPFYLLLAASVFSVGAADADTTLQTFGGGHRWDFTYIGSAHAFFPFGDATSLLVGLNYARGRTSQSLSQNPLLPNGSGGGPTPYDNIGDNLYGADVYFKWKPPNQAQTYASVAWQTEYFLRQLSDRVDLGGGVTRRQLEGGLYSQVVIQAFRRWYFGVRGEVMGIPEGDNVRREYAGAASVTWGLSEFARIRAYGEVRYGSRFMPLDPTPPPPQRVAGAGFVQIEAAIGAHGAHPY